MDVDAFKDSPAGRLVPIRGHDAYLGRDYDHFAFVPNPLPDTVPLTERTYKAISEAERAIGRLDAGAVRLPNPALLVRPALRREAVSTSALEGTYAPLSEVLEADYVEERKRSTEVREILNYVRAAERGLQLVKIKPVCLTLVSELQGILVRDTRGDAFDAGRLRERQVYIGERALGIERSRFVPPPEGDLLRDGVYRWESWINREDDVPLLAKVAIGHYQFEALHPYSDGNGRLGRLIVTLQLVVAGALKYPILNLSPWLEPRKDEYKDKLRRVSQCGEFDDWIQFFCEAVRAQADDGVRRIDDLLGVREEILATLRADGAQGVVLGIVDDLIGYPVITPSIAARMHNVTYPPANKAIQRMARLGILREITGRTYGRVYACERILRIVERP